MKSAIICIQIQEEYQAFEERDWRNNILNQAVHGGGNNNKKAENQPIRKIKPKNFSDWSKIPRHQKSFILR